MKRGDFLGKINDYERARMLAEEGVPQTPNDPEAYRILARVHGLFHLFAEAEADLAQAEAHGANPVELVSARANIVAARGDLDQAIATRDGRKDPLSSGEMATVGLLYLDAGRESEGTAMLERSRKEARGVDPFPMAWLDYQEAVLRERHGQEMLAKQLYERAHRLLPMYAAAAAHLAPYLGSQDAVVMLEPIAKHSDDPEVLAALATALRKAGRTVDAKRDVELAGDRYDDLVKRHEAAYADHAARFWLGEGKDPAKAYDLAEKNLALRQTSPAYDSGPERRAGLQARQGGLRHRDARARGQAHGRIAARRRQEHGREPLQARSPVALTARRRIPGYAGRMRAVKEVTAVALAVCVAGGCGSGSAGVGEDAGRDAGHATDGLTVPEAHADDARAAGHDASKDATSTAEAGGGEAGTYWTPSSATPTHFHWQLSTVFSAPRDVLPGDGPTVYDIDGQENDAATVAALHALGPDVKVVCYVDVGTWEPERPDAKDFPSSVIGADVCGWPGEKWLDVRQQSVLLPLMKNRFQTWCWQGLRRGRARQPRRLGELARASPSPRPRTSPTIRDRGPRPRDGPLDGTEEPARERTTLEPNFDWALDEQCFQYSECTYFETSFIAKGKAVFDVEYNQSPDCTKATASMLNAQKRDLDLVGPKASGYLYQPCIPDTQATW